MYGNNNGNFNNGNNNSGNFMQGVQNQPQRNNFNGGQKRQVSDREKQLKATRIVLEGFLYFPKLVTPETTQDGALRWGAVLGFDKNLTQHNQQAFAQARAVVGELKQMFFPTLPDQMFNLQGNPIKEHGVNFRQDGGQHPEFYTNKYWINVSKRNEAPPIVARGNGTIVTLNTQSPELYFGQRVAMTISFYPSGLTNPLAKKGIGANVEAILILGGGERLGEASAPPVDVNQAFAAFSNDTVGLSNGSNATAGFNSFQETTPSQGQNYNQGQQNYGQGNNMGNQNVQNVQHQQGGFGMGGGQQHVTNASPSNPQQGQNFGQNFGQQNTNPFGNNNNNGQGNGFI